MLTTDPSKLADLSDRAFAAFRRLTENGASYEKRDRAFVAFNKWNTRFSCIFALGQARGALRSLSQQEAWAALGNARDRGYERRLRRSLREMIESYHYCRKSGNARAVEGLPERLGARHLTTENLW